jgi:serine protease Do
MKRVVLALWIATTAGMSLAQPGRAVLEAESQRVAAMERVKDCVLAVFPLSGEGGGSGVVISPDGYALSNFHVAQPCGRAMQCGMADGRVYDAAIVGIDPTGDVALIKLFGRDDFSCAALGDSDQVRAGDWVFAMGNPFMLATDMQPTVTYGIVSGVHRYQFPAGTLLEYADCLQIDASINPGNSGGPLFDIEGRLIGINGRASFEKRGRVNVGGAYAISINQIKNFLGGLRSGRIVDHASLGATVGFDSEGRVVVTNILETSDAYRRGLRYDDEIIQFGGRPIATPNGLKNILGIFPDGWRVPLSYRRDGERHDILVRLAPLHRQAELIELISASPPVPTPEPKPNDTPQPTEKKVELPVPEVVEQHFVEKRGYANYYFNTLNQQRVWSKWIARSNLANAEGVWTLVGDRSLPSPASGRGTADEDGSRFQFQLSDEGVSLQLPSKDITWSAKDDISASMPPANSGGLLAAMYLWRRLAVEGLDRFGEVFYEGTAPLGDRQADVLVGMHKGIECRFYFDSDAGELLAIEMFCDEYSDPCEIYFSDYQQRDGRLWPRWIEVRHGDDRFAVFEVKEARCE